MLHPAVFRRVYADSPCFPPGVDQGRSLSIQKIRSDYRLLRKTATAQFFSLIRENPPSFLIRIEYGNISLFRNNRGRIRLVFLQKPVISP